MVVIHSINKALLALGMLLTLAGILLPNIYMLYGGVFLAVVSAVLSYFLLREQKAINTSHKIQIATHETRIADQDAQLADQGAQIAGHKAEMANKDTQISDLKQSASESTVAIENK